MLIGRNIIAFNVEKNWKHGWNIDVWWKRHLINVYDFRCRIDTALMLRKTTLMNHQCKHCVLHSNVRKYSKKKGMKRSYSELFWSLVLTSESAMNSFDFFQDFNSGKSISIELLQWGHSLPHLFWFFSNDNFFDLLLLLGWTAKKPCQITAGLD